MRPPVSGVAHLAKRTDEAWKVFEVGAKGEHLFDGPLDDEGELELGGAPARAGLAQGFGDRPVRGDCEERHPGKREERARG